MVRELGVGIVGYGFIGKVQTYAYRAIPFFHDVLPFKIRLVGVCDSNRKIAEHAVEVDDIALVQARLRSGAIGVIEASRLATGANDELRFEAHGSMGSIHFNCMEPNWLSVYDCRDADAPIGGWRGFKKIETVQRYPPPATLPVPKQAVGWMRYHVASICDFLLNVVQGTPCRPSFEEGARVNEIIDAAYRSAKESRWVALPPAGS